MHFLPLLLFACNLLLVSVSFLSSRWIEVGYTSDFFVLQRTHKLWWKPYVFCTDKHDVLFCMCVWLPVSWIVFRTKRMSGNVTQYQRVCIGRDIARSIAAKKTEHSNADKEKKTVWTKKIFMSRRKMDETEKEWCCFCYKKWHQLVSPCTRYGINNISATIVWLN